MVVVTVRHVVVGRRRDRGRQDRAAGVKRTLHRPPNQRAGGLRPHGQRHGNADGGPDGDGDAAIECRLPNWPPRPNDQRHPGDEAVGPARLEGDDRAHQSGDDGERQPDALEAEREQQADRDRGPDCGGGQAGEPLRHRLVAVQLQHE